MFLKVIQLKFNWARDNYIYIFTTSYNLESARQREKEMRKEAITIMLHTHHEKGVNGNGVVRL